MELKRLNPNHTSVSVKGVRVFFSYDVPIVLIDFNKRIIFCTTTKHSNTTSKHMVFAIKNYNMSFWDLENVAQEYLDLRVKEI